VFPVIRPRINRISTKIKFQASPTLNISSRSGSLAIFDRNWLKGALGDTINAVLCGTSHNLRMIIRKLRRFGSDTASDLVQSKFSSVPIGRLLCCLLWRAVHQLDHAIAWSIWDVFTSGARNSHYQRRGFAPCQLAFSAVVLGTISNNPECNYFVVNN
jgi:hypothetical protein